MANVIQWNIRGLSANNNELLILMQSFQSIAFCLQEIKISNFYQFPNSVHLCRSYRMWIKATHLLVDLGSSNGKIYHTVK
jgi:exonuclease III